VDPNTNIGSGHVFKSVDAGESFVDISGNLPDVPVFWVTLRGNQLLAGTQIGPFISSDTSGTEWAPLGTGLPNVPIAQLATAPGDLTQMFAATFGRGIWRYRFPGEADICIAPVAPLQGAPTNVETPATAPACGTDTNGAYTLNFSYATPAGGVPPVKFRLQEATIFEDVFFDNADEALSGGANSLWQAEGDWSSQPNPSSGSLAYYAPATMDQSDTLTMIDAIDLPAGSATLTFATTQSTEACCDFVGVEVSIDDGATFESVGSFSGDFIGERQVDLSPFTGNAVKLRFKVTADPLVPGPGVFVEDITINAGNFATIDEVAGSATSHALTRPTEGTRHYRIAGLFGSGELLGPYSNIECVTVDLPVNELPVANAGTDFSVNEGQSAMLSGAASSDPENGALNYAWTQVSGPTVTLTGADAATASFTAPIVALDTPLTFQLQVTDDQGQVDVDDIVVSVVDVPGGGDPPAPRIGNNKVGAWSWPALLWLAGGLLLRTGRRRRVELGSFY
jgi:hypothetical protein